MEKLQIFIAYKQTYIIKSNLNEAMEELEIPRKAIDLVKITVDT